VSGLILAELHIASRDADVHAEQQPVAHVEASPCATNTSGLLRWPVVKNGSSIFSVSSKCLPDCARTLKAATSIPRDSERL
jgi:hypothetical protein